MNIEDYFPKGIACGVAFCNRQLERKRLAENIVSGSHTLLISPRRYGKTSLVRHVIAEMGVIYGEADLFVAVDAERIQQTILASIKTIIQQACSTIEQAMTLLMEFLPKISSKWFIGTQGFKIELLPQNTDPATAILESLQALEYLLAKKKIRAVLFIDEIQEIGEVAEGRGIEGAIRHVAQEAKFLTFIFSGSKRHLLSNMFYDRARPLYKLCDRITLERIHAEDYAVHLNNYATQSSWHQPLPPQTLETLFILTELHPYYINALCAKVWRATEIDLPTSALVESCWKKMIEEEKQEMMQEISALNPSQRKILAAIATDAPKAFTSKIFLKKMNLSGSTVIEALQQLAQKDYIKKHEDTGVFSIIDPLLKSTLSAT